MLMPYSNEHAARVADEGACEAKSFRRMNQGAGVSLILCKIDGKMKAVSYRFDMKKFTEAQAREWMDKHDLKILAFDKANPDPKVKAKLSMKARNGMPEVDGRIWSAGLHHVFVNDKPARIYVPESTIMQTFGSIQKLIKDQGRMPIGIDHLSDSVLGENEILAKMNLLDVGDVTKVGTDGSSIYILDSELTNDAIKGLHQADELPAFSIVGAMDASPCPTGKADYVVNGIDVDRVDFVEEGGCSVCKVGAQPDELILTSRKSMEEYDMVEANDASLRPVDSQYEAVVEGVDNNGNIGEHGYKEETQGSISEADSIRAEAGESSGEGAEGQGLQEGTGKEEASVSQEEGVTQEGDVDKPDGVDVSLDEQGNSSDQEGNQEGQQGDSEEELADDASEEDKEEEAEEKEVSEIDELKKEIQDLKEMLGGKKPKEVTASSSFNVDEEITKLIKAGKATPAMKDALRQVASESVDGFKAMAASMPKFVNMKMESKFAQMDKQAEADKKAKAKQKEEDDMNAIVKKYFNVDLKQ